MKRLRVLLGLLAVSLFVMAGTTQVNAAGSFVGDSTLRQAFIESKKVINKTGVTFTPVFFWSNSTRTTTYNPLSVLGFNVFQKDSWDGRTGFRTYVQPTLTNKLPAFSDQTFTVGLDFWEPLFDPEVFNLAPGSPMFEFGDCLCDRDGEVFETYSVKLIAKNQFRININTTDQVDVWLSSGRIAKVVHSYFGEKKTSVSYDYLASRIKSRWLSAVSSYNSMFHASTRAVIQKLNRALTASDLAFWNQGMTRQTSTSVSTAFDMFNPKTKQRAYFEYENPNINRPSTVYFSNTLSTFEEFWNEFFRSWYWKSSISYDSKKRLITSKEMGFTVSLDSSGRITKIVHQVEDLSGSVKTTETFSYSTTNQRAKTWLGVSVDVKNFIQFLSKDGWLGAESELIIVSDTEIQDVQNDKVHTFKGLESPSIAVEAFKLLGLEYRVYER